MRSEGLKVAIVHYWLVNERGGEKVLAALCDLFPEADVYTHVLDGDKTFSFLRGRRVFTSFIQKLPWAVTWYQNYLPLMPLALEQLDLSGYDLVLSSESGPAKGVLTSAGTTHICYCHSPMRYLWDMYHGYLRSAGWLKKVIMVPVFHYLRMWDRLSADRVDHFIANSENVARRIQKHYRREADVVHPPVDLEAFEPSENRQDYYLMVGELVGYKRADLVVRAFQHQDRRLVVVGDGEQMALLKRLAGPNVTLLGRCPAAELRRRYSECRALIFPGEEDFGIVPVEAMASGSPVIAFGRGGALETVREGVSGMFFHEQTEEAVRDALDRFEAVEELFQPEEVRLSVQHFSVERFKGEILERVLRFECL